MVSDFFSSIYTDLFFHEKEQKEELETNFKEEIVNIIVAVEKSMVYGLLQCFSALLYTLVILPLKSLLSPNINTALRTGILIGVSMLLSFYLSFSRLYHDLKEQDFLKLNAIYNMIGIADQLLMSFGQKTIKGISNSTDNFFIVILYVIVHTVHLSLALTVFEVALNSSTYNLSLIVLTGAFVEIKITVFKKNDKKTLMNVLYNDIIERLQIFLYLFTIFCKAVITNTGNLELFSRRILIVVGTSMLIDWIKHYYVMHYSGLNCKAYSEILEKMKKNWKSAYTNGTFTDGEIETQCVIDPCCSIALSYKFTALPQACMVKII